MKREYAYFPGCLLTGSAREYGKSFEAVCAAARVDLKEIADWNCCGGASARLLAPGVAEGLAWRNLAIAAQQGGALAVPCAVGWRNLVEGRRALDGAGERLPEAGIATEAGELAAVEIVHALEVLSTGEVLCDLVEKVQDPLAGFKVACFYGCVLGGKDWSRPSEGEEGAMERILGALGAEVVEWKRGADCCGGSLGLAARDVVCELAGEIIKSADDAGANCISVACPWCHSSLDMWQFEISRRAEHKVEMPVFYFTELAAAALDLPGTEGWLKRHVTTVFPLVDALLELDLD